jgi:hypothetical protein
VSNSDFKNLKETECTVIGLRNFQSYFVNLLTNGSIDPPRADLRVSMSHGWSDVDKGRPQLVSLRPR